MCCMAAPGSRPRLHGVPAVRPEVGQRVAGAAALAERPHRERLGRLAVQMGTGEVQQVAQDVLAAPGVQAALEVEVASGPVQPTRPRAAYWRAASWKASAATGPRHSASAAGGLSAWPVGGP